MNPMDADRGINQDTASRICEAAVTEMQVDGKRLLLLIPDLSRTCPLDQLFPLLYQQLAPRVAQLDILVALGTHRPLTDAEIYHRVGIRDCKEHAQRYPAARFHNHAFDDPEQLTQVGRLSSAQVSELTEGRLEIEVQVTCNRMVLDHDLLLILGPVFPHEVVGFSGGNKYIFPGISGEEVLHFFHWLGALITTPAVIGQKHTPVRKVIDLAAQMLPIERHALCMVVGEAQLAGLFHGTPEHAWSKAADLSANLHVVHTGRRFHTVLSCAPAMYEDLWTGAKCMYKLEPVVEDGGELIIHAPHITQVSKVHGEILERIGYHCRDYFLEHWEEYRSLPWGILAHSTHLRGSGQMQAGVERPRIAVTLATGIPEATCRSVGLGYLDPSLIVVESYHGRESEGVLCVPRAGEILYLP